MGNGAPECPVDGCDGNLYREFKTGLNQSTAQMMRWGGVALIIVPIAMGAPFVLERIRQPGGVAGLIAVLVVVAVPMLAGLLLLRHRAQRMAERSEQQRCNKCGAVFQGAAAS